MSRVVKRSASQAVKGRLIAPQRPTPLPASALFLFRPRDLADAVVGRSRTAIPRELFLPASFRRRCMTSTIAPPGSRRWRITPEYQSLSFCVAFSDATSFG